jgi:DNA polymerase
MARDLADCQRCALAKGRTQVVFGTGDPDARLLFIGEGPGADEDRLGEPFVGRAGQLLTKIIEAMGLRRGDVYIANVVKCRPPGNRVPMFEEVQACSPFLREQIAIIRPELIVALGATAARALLGTTASMSSLRGRFHDFQGTPVLCTYHPAYLLRNPAEKGKVWEDMKVAMKRLGLPMPEGR